MMIRLRADLFKSAIVLCLIASSSTLVQAGLIAHWTADGNTLDASGNGNDGTADNGLSYGAGIAGQAFSFDGVDDYVRVEDNSMLEVNNYTISAWVNVARQPPPTMMILQKGTADGTLNRNGYFLDYRAAGATQLSQAHVDASNGFQQNSVNASLNVGEWNHVVSTYDGSAMRLFLNGTQIGSFATTTGPDYVGDRQDLTIGIQEANPANFPPDGLFNAFSGLIDDIQIYDYALGQSQVEFLFDNPGASVPEPSCFALLLCSLAGLTCRRRKREL